MKKILKVALGLVGAVFLAVGLLVAFAYLNTNAALAATWDIDPVAVSVSTDSATLAHGRHVAEIRGCLDCHGQDLAGRVVIDAAPVMGVMAGTNLTRGEGGVGARYTAADYVRAIRDGVGADGRSLQFMPSYEYRALGPKDLGALVSYILSAPPVDGAPPETRFGPVPRVLYLFGNFPLLSAEMVDHSDTRFEQPEEGVTVEYGGYLATGCVGCHGPGFTGGKIPGGDPSWPPAANLTPHESGLAGWTLEDFHAFAASGTTPDGRTLDPTVMPWTLLGAATPEERDALWLFLASLPPAEKGNR